MTETIINAQQQIQTFLEKNIIKYKYCILKMEQNENKEKFKVIFSYPTQQKPIPSEIVNSYFFVEDQQVKFQFETDSLIHLLNRTVIQKKFEEWIDQYIIKKQITKKMLFCGTEFELTRIQDKRFQEINKEIIIEKQVHEYFIDNELQQSYLKKENETQALNIIKDFVLMLFAHTDTNNLGLISIDELLILLKKFYSNIDFNVVSNIFNSYDQEGLGILPFEKIKGLFIEITLIILAYNQYNSKMDENKEIYEFEASLYLMADDFLDNIKLMNRELHKLDDKQRKVLPPETILKVFNKYSSKYEQEISNEIIDELLACQEPKRHYYDIGEKIFQFMKGQAIAGVSSKDVIPIQEYLNKNIKYQEKEKYVQFEQVLSQLQKLEKIQITDIQKNIILALLFNENQQLEVQNLNQKIGIIISFLYSDLYDNRRSFLFNYDFKFPLMKKITPENVENLKTYFNDQCFQYEEKQKLMIDNESKIIESPLKLEDSYNEKKQRRKNKFNSKKITIDNKVENSTEFLDIVNSNHSIIEKKSPIFLRTTTKTLDQMFRFGINKRTFLNVFSSLQNIPMNKTRELLEKYCNEIEVVMLDEFIKDFGKDLLLKMEINEFKQNYDNIKQLIYQYVLYVQN